VRIFWTLSNPCFLIQTGLALGNFFLGDFALTRLAYLHHFKNLGDIFRLTGLAYNLCWRLAESDVAVTPSVTCVDWLRWWYNHAADVVPPSTTLAFVNKMSEKRKTTTSCAVKVKIRRKTISTEDKLDVTSRLGKGDRIVWHMLCC